MKSFLLVTVAFFSLPGNKAQSALSDEIIRVPSNQVRSTVPGIDVGSLEFVRGKFILTQNGEEKFLYSEKLASEKVTVIVGHPHLYFLIDAYSRLTVEARLLGGMMPTPRSSEMDVAVRKRMEASAALRVAFEGACGERGNPDSLGHLYDMLAAVGKEIWTVQYAQLQHARSTRAPTVSAFEGSTAAAKARYEASAAAVIAYKSHLGGGSGAASRR